MRISSLAAWQRGMLAASLMLWLGACSGGEQAEEAVAAGKAKEAEVDLPAEPPADMLPTPAEEPPPPPPVASKPQPPPPPPPPAAPAEPPGFDQPPAKMFVTSFALNVRSLPSKDSPVVGHVKMGDQVAAAINGEWAKIAPGRYISSKHLSPEPPKQKGGGAKKK